MSSVLVVDDEAAMRHLVTRWVEAAGYTAGSASSANEALAMLARHPSAIAVCDVRMPGHDGLWLAERIGCDFPDTAVVVASAARDTDARVAEHTGAVDYLAKPFARARLQFALDRGFDWHHAAAKRREWLRHLTGEMQARRGALYVSAAALRCPAAETVEALLTYIGDDDADLLAHSRRVAEMALRMGCALGLTAQELGALNEAALLHDLGKLGLPHSILRKPAALSPDEKALVRHHPAVATELLRSFGGFDGVAAVLRAVNEWFDGRRCDRAVPEQAVLLSGRIVAIADAYDAMTHRQIYRDAMPSFEATQEILRCSGIQFDPVVASVLLEVLGESAVVH